MNINDYIEKQINSDHLDALFEGFGPDAWPDMNLTIKQVATALKKNDPHALMDAVRAQFYEYLKRVADGDGVDLIEEESVYTDKQDFYEPDDYFDGFDFGPLDPLIAD
jgi:hypothetical protein